jgi:hypothetical protein
MLAHTLDETCSLADLRLTLNTHTHAGVLITSHALRSLVVRIPRRVSACAELLLRIRAPDIITLRLVLVVSEWAIDEQGLADPSLRHLATLARVSADVYCWKLINPAPPAGCADLVGFLTARMTALVQYCL